MYKKIIISLSLLLLAITPKVFAKPAMQYKNKLYRFMPHLQALDYKGKAGRYSDVWVGLGSEDNINSLEFVGFHGTHRNEKAYRTNKDASSIYVVFNIDFSNTVYNNKKYLAETGQSFKFENVNCSLWMQRTFNGFDRRFTSVNSESSLEDYRDAVCDGKVKVLKYNKKRGNITVRVVAKPKSMSIEKINLRTRRVVNTKFSNNKKFIFQYTTRII
jgi:hypothetical protein